MALAAELGFAWIGVWIATWDEAVVERMPIVSDLVAVAIAVAVVANS